MPSQPSQVVGPVDDDALPAVTVGLVLWAVATVACLLLRDRLAENGASWWLGTCLIGLIAGIVMRLLFAERARRIALGGPGTGGGSGGAPDGSDATALG